MQRLVAFAKYDDVSFKTKENTIILFGLCLCLLLSVSVIRTRYNLEH